MDSIRGELVKEGVLKKVEITEDDAIE